MTKRNNVISAYIPQPKRDRKVFERLARLAEQQDRSMNHLLVDAILEYLDREEDHSQESSSTS
jgi:predicted transcriptional regulator